MLGVKIAKVQREANKVPKLRINHIPSPLSNLRKLRYFAPEFFFGGNSAVEKASAYFRNVKSKYQSRLFQKPTSIYKLFKCY